MASNLESSIHIGSDLFFDVSCFTCKGNDRNTEAEFFCEDCSKVYCGKCLEHHNFLYQKHATSGKKNMSKWSVSEATFDVLEQCQVHRDRKFEILCEDHSEMMCTICHFYNHRKCSQVVLIADKVKDLQQKGEFKQLSAALDDLHGQLILKKHDFEENLKSLEQSYNTILEEINALRKAINDTLDQLERNTIKELDTLLAKLSTSIQTDNKYCNESIKKMTSVKEDLLTTKSKSEAIQLILFRKCLDLSVKTKEVLQEMTVKKDTTISFTPDPIIQQTMRTISGLGKIFIKENTVTTETKHKECCTSISNNDPENQTSNNNKQSLDSSPVSGTPRQADIANQTSDLIKPDTTSNQISIKPKQGDIPNETNAACKPGHVSNAISSSSTQSDIRSDANIFDDFLRAYSNHRRFMSKSYRVNIKSDSHQCCITGICETATGDLLITDCSNKKVKLLDQTYKVVAHCELDHRPYSMCSIDSSLVAIAMGINEVHFIRVTNGQLIKDRTLNLQHACYSIAHHQGNLYISSIQALYHYTVNGRLVSKLYNVTRHGWQGYYY